MRALSGARYTGVRLYTWIKIGTVPINERSASTRIIELASGVLIAYVRFTRATNWSEYYKGDQLYTLACLVDVYL